MSVRLSTILGEIETLIEALTPTTPGSPAVSFHFADTPYNPEKAPGDDWHRKCWLQYEGFSRMEWHGHSFDVRDSLVDLVVGFRMDEFGDVLAAEQVISQDVEQISQALTYPVNKGSATMIDCLGARVDLRAPTFATFRLSMIIKHSVDFSL